IAEPALLLLAFALAAFAGAIGNAHALDAHRLRRRVVLGGIEGGVRRDQARWTSQLGLVCFDGRDQQVRIARPPTVDLIVDHDLILGFLQFHHLAELVRFAGLALADDFGCGLEQAEDLALRARLAVVDAFPRLPHDMTDPRQHRIELLAQAIQRELLQHVGRLLYAFGELGWRFDGAWRPNRSRAVQPSASALSPHRTRKRRPSSTACCQRATGMSSETAGRLYSGRGTRSGSKMGHDGP